MVMSRGQLLWRIKCKERQRWPFVVVGSCCLDGTPVKVFGSASGLPSCFHARSVDRSALSLLAGYSHPSPASRFPPSHVLSFRRLCQPHRPPLKCSTCMCEAAQSGRSLPPSRHCHALQVRDTYGNPPEHWNNCTALPTY